MRSAVTAAGVAVLIPTPAQAQVVGQHGRKDLVIATAQGSKAVVVVAKDAGPWEKRAAADLRKYIALMTGSTPSIVEGAAPKGREAIVIGKQAIAADGETARALARVAKKRPTVQADAISAHRVGNRLYLAGSNDESNYFAVSWLLQQWGCRWYLPTSFGEVVPERAKLAIGKLAFAYAPPFEIRHYWLSWNADSTGADEFRHRNFMSTATVPGAAQALDQYTRDIALKGGTSFNVPFADPKTAEHVATKIEADYAAGKDVTLAVSDGLYSNDDPGDRALITQYDKYMLKPSMTDNMMTLYNNVAAILHRRYPESKTKIGGMAYVNVTLPPQRVTVVDPSLVMWIAPIDIDPNHAMDDSRSPARAEYRAMIERWSTVMGGRLAIYDYDQGMLSWRDLPDPSQDVFARDVKEYERLHILGIGTESRGASATTFLNLFFRGQLMWDPDAKTEAMLAEFYPLFYGPAAVPMASYWGRIFAAWRATSTTEHDMLSATAIYTPALVDALRADLEEAERIMTASAGRMGRDEAAYRERMKFTRLSFGVIDNYVGMVAAGAGAVDYATAVRRGEAALSARLELARMNPTFTTHVLGVEAETPRSDPSTFEGEVQQLRTLADLTDGKTGRLSTKLPLDWSFRLGAPMPAGWVYGGARGGDGPCATGDAFIPSQWRQVRTDVYLQGQGVLRPNGENDLGEYCYRTSVTVADAEIAGKTKIMFPGLFNEAWLYVNGVKVAHREYGEPWWKTDYRFEWDVDLTPYLRPGPNTITLGGFNPHHFAGMFRRPFLYHPLNGGL
jgi:hypothetical protein